jgi:mannose-6-phosphate isomerase-like protein (cupin superfamily)
VAVFQTKHLPMDRMAIAPDGSDVRVLLGLASGGMAHFELGPGQISKAVTHRSVEEIWYFLSGRGQMWRRQNGEASIVDVYPAYVSRYPLALTFSFAHSATSPWLPLA